MKPLQKDKPNVLWLEYQGGILDSTMSPVRREGVNVTTIDNFTDAIAITKEDIEGVDVIVVMEPQMPLEKGSRFGAFYVSDLLNHFRNNIRYEGDILVHSIENLSGHNRAICEKHKVGIYPKGGGEEMTKLTDKIFESLKVQPQYWQKGVGRVSPGSLD